MPPAGKVWLAGHVIAQDGGGLDAEENRAGRRKLFRHLVGAARHDFQMLGREAVGQFDASSEIGDFDQPSVSVEGAGNDLAAGGLGELPGYFLLHGAQELAGRGQKPDAFVAGTVFRLGQKIGGNARGVGGVIGQDEQFAGAGEQVYGGAAEQQPLGCDDISIAGAKNFVDFWKWCRVPRASAAMACAPPMRNISVAPATRAA